MSVPKISIALVAALCCAQVSFCYQAPAKNIIVHNTGMATLIKCEDRRGTPEFHPMVYIPSSQRCEKLFSEGPCEEGNWLYSVDGLVKCSPNPCQDKGQPGVTVPLNGKCVSLNSSCRADLYAFGTVRFIEGFLPECVPRKARANSKVNARAISVLSVGGIGPTECPENTYRTPNGLECTELMYFEYD